MATPAEHEALYVSLRADLLGRFFAATHAFASYQLADELSLVGANPAPDGSTRWSKVVGTTRENPGVYGAKLLTALAVESSLGNSESTTALRLAIEAMSSLYRQPETTDFAGYPIRWDPTGARYWEFDAGGEPGRCWDFLLDQDGAYIWSVPISDPRHRAARPAMRQLLTKFQFEEYLKSDGGLKDDGTWSLWGWDYKDRHRRWEPSMDEICGLVATYGAVHTICSDSQIRNEIESQADKLGRYLARHGYLIVRPTGGLTSRGSSGVNPALEYPINAVLSRVTGKDYRSEANFAQALQAAGIWDLFAGEITAAQIGFFFAGPIVNPVLGALRGLAGLAAPSCRASTPVERWLLLDPSSTCSTWPPRPCW